MKTDYTKIYHDLLNQYIAAIPMGDTLGPEEVNTIRFNLRGLIIAYFIVAKEEPSKISDIQDIKGWLCSTMGAGNIFLTIINECPKQIVDNLLLEAPDIPEDDFGYTYEKFLSIDANQIQASYDDRNRNETGSYYTPVELADFTIKTIVSRYITENSKESLQFAKVADFSCGSGVFLTEYLKYVASLGVEKKLAAENLYGFDVDPIALEITKYNVLLELGDLTKYNVISGHFRHCNFLLNKNSGLDAEHRIESSRKGYIYDTALSINQTSLSHFEIVLGNPPWEKIRFEEKAIRDLYEGYAGGKLQDYIRKSQTDIDSAKKEIKKSGYYAAANNGELNTYALFTKAAVNQLASRGTLGLIVKSSLLTSQVYSNFFKDIRENVFAIYDFVNVKKIFDIDSRERFSIICISETRNNDAKVGMNITSVKDADKISETIDLKDCDIINPVTGTLPNVKSIAEIGMLVDMHRNARYFYNEYKVKYGRLVHLTNHKEHIVKESKVGYIPIYEGKFLAQFNANYSGFNHVPEKKRYTKKATSSPLSLEEIERGIHPECRYFISETKWKEISRNYDADYMLAWHSLTSASNSITCVATILPFIPTCQSIQFLTSDNEKDLLYLTGLFNSSVFEYILKKKLNGIDLTRTIIDQMPVPAKGNASEIEIKEKKYLAKKVIENAVAFLLKDDDRLTDLALRNVDVEILSQIQSRKYALQIIDEAIAVQYGLSAAELSKIKKALD